MGVTATIPNRRRTSIINTKSWFKISDIQSIVGSVPQVFRQGNSTFYLRETKGDNCLYLIQTTGWFNKKVFVSQT